MSADSRRSSSSSAHTQQSGSFSSIHMPPSSPLNRTSSIVRHNNGSKKKLNPIRRCQSMKNPNVSTTGNSMTNGIQSSPSFRSASRRPSQVAGYGGGSEHNGRKDSGEFVKYYQYKNYKAEPLIPFKIIIDDGKTPITVDNKSEKGTKCRVLVLGSQSSGKTSLIRHFARYVHEQDSETSDSDEHLNQYANPYENYHSKENGRHTMDKNAESKPVLMIKFKETVSLETFYRVSNHFHPDAYIVVYAVNSRESFESAKKIISEIYKWDDFESRTVILVANKTDLVRSRIISKQEGRQLAITNNCKYIETSCAISHNVDCLLAGISAQITLKNNSNQNTANYNAINESKKPPPRKLTFIKRFLKKAVLNKSKSCDNLHVL